ncbi:MAG: Calx-beta domain-containing protein, partial [Pyrinomonadaceae bacterium]
IGAVRLLPAPLDLTGAGRFTVPEGEVSLLGVVSEQAVQVRVHFADMNLGPGARVFVYSLANPDEVYGPYEGRGPTKDGEFWSPPVGGDGVVVEYFDPHAAERGGAGAPPPFRISKITHVYAGASGGSSSEEKAAGACNLNVTSEWGEVAKSVGRMSFVSGSSSFVCTGTLLNTLASDGTPYFLTANHCINTPAEAQSLQVAWFYNTPGTPTSFTNGSTLLETGTQSDFTLLRLTGTLPGGLYFSGWTTTMPSASTSITGIHHPDGDYKRISFGNVRSGSCPSGVTSCLPVGWSSGTTEGGSSGSGVWTGTPADARLVGNLHGGAASCQNLSGSDYYGRFDTTYQRISSYLTGTPTQGPPNDNFAAAQSISGTTGSASVNTSSATREAGEPNHGPDGDPNGMGNKSVWYRWAAAAGGPATLTTAGSNFDTVLAVYTGSSVGALTSVAKNDDVTPPNDTTSRVNFNAVAGTVYYIAVDGYGGNAGNAVLNWTLPATATAPTIQFSAATYNIPEAGGASVTLTRAGDTSVAASVDLTAATPAFQGNCAQGNGSAANPKCDYSTLGGTVRFAPGQTSRALFVPVIDDAYLEGNETISVSLSNAQGGATLGAQSSATLSIVDNDTATGTSPIYDASFFVRQQYLDFLAREPDQASFQSYVGTISGCPGGGFGLGNPTCDRVHVSKTFFQSQEFQTRGYFAYRFYEVALGRRPSYAEFYPDMLKVGGAQSPQEEAQSKAEFTDAFVLRQEFMQKYNTITDPTAYVTELERGADVAVSNKAFLIGELTAGRMTRAQVLREIAESVAVEQRFFNEAFVAMQYFGYQRRDPDEASFAVWVSELNGTGDYRRMIFNFIYSDEYILRFGLK